MTALYHRFSSSLFPTVVHLAQFFNGTHYTDTLANKEASHVSDRTASGARRRALTLCGAAASTCTSFQAICEERSLCRPQYGGKPFCRGITTNEVLFTVWCKFCGNYWTLLFLRSSMITIPLKESSAAGKALCRFQKSTNIAYLFLPKISSPSLRKL